MYPSFPLFVVFEKLLLGRLARTLSVFKVQGPDIKEFVSYGRVDLDRYSWFDRMNCHFCAYANGIGQMVSVSLDMIGRQNMDSLGESEKKIVQKQMRGAFNLAAPIGLFSYFVFVVTISGLLRYDKPDRRGIISSLKGTGFGKGLKSEGFTSMYADTFKLRFLFSAFEHTLSIIESNWCPLTYAKKEALLRHQEDFVSTGYDDVVKYIMDESKDRKG